MVKKANKAGRRKDKYYQLAKEQGYRARSAFKLIQLNKKYDFLAKSSVCIDLCAAPGGWLQVAAKYMPSGATIIGVDLMPIKAIRGVITHTEDITTPECRAVLKRDMTGRKADVILHDGAPNVGQNWSKDAFTQSSLVLCALKLATEFLRPHGLFITKIFRSADYNSLLWVFHQLFNKVEATKPHSSRNASAEIFVACRDFKAPDKIDPRLLDPKYVFKDIDDLTGTASGLAGGGGGSTLTVMDKKASSTHKRHRDGYDETLGPLLMRRVRVMDFLRSNNAVRALTDASCFLFDEESARLGVDAHALTTEDIRAACDDLKLLAKKDFKALLKWRFLIRKALPEVAARVRPPREKYDDDDAEEDGAGEGAEEISLDSDEDEHARDMAQLSAAASEELRRRKNEKKREAKVRSKAIRRQQLGMNLRSVDVLDSDTSLFSLDALKRIARRAGADGDAVMDAVRDVALDDEDVDEVEQDDDIVVEGGLKEVEEEELQGSDDDDYADGLTGVTERLKRAEDRERLDEVEDELDRAYAAFVAKRDQRSAMHKEGIEGNTSKGIKLTRRQRLEKQALLTEAALNGQLDAEQQKYLDLLSAARKTAEEAATSDAPLPLAGTKRRRVASPEEEDEDDEDEDEDEEEEEQDEEGDDEQEEEDSGRRGVGARARDPTTSSVSAATRAARWFSREIFADALAEEELTGVALPRASRAAAPKGQLNIVDDDAELAPEDDWLAGIPKSDREKRKDKLRKLREKDAATAARRAAKEDIKVVAAGAAAQDEADIQFARVLQREGATPAGGDGLDDAVVRKKRALLRAGMGRAAATAGAPDDSGDIEVVSAHAGMKRRRQADSDSEDDDDDNSDEDAEAAADPMPGATALENDPHFDPRSPVYDADAHAQLLAMGKRLRKHSTAKALVDASYNRYSFDDPDSLPSWFVADERRHFHAQMPIEKSEIEAIKARFRDISARPIARVAEARARKKRRLTVKVEKAKKAAENVLESEEVQGRSRAKALAKLARAATSNVRKKTEYVVSGKGGTTPNARRKGGANVRVVDPREKKDKRALKRAAKKGGKRKRR